MKLNSPLITVVVVLWSLIGSMGVNAAPASAEDINELQIQLQKQQKEITQLQEKIELTAEMLEMQTEAAPQTGGHGASGNTQIGGYGELHYNNLRNQTEGGDDQKEIDLHRAILFVGHDFNERIRFWSELEVEHAQAGDGKSGGEVSMEQAYIEFDLNDNMSTRAGVLLVPVGILNETHEPTTFYGVERNPIESNIIPTTWREGGVSLMGKLAEAVSYDLLIHSGLETGSADNYAVRKGRNSVRKASANDLAYTGRIKWTGMAGVELAATLQYQGDITQGNDVGAGAATLFETHAIVQHGAFAVRALFADWNLSGSGASTLGANRQTGWYIEPAYKLNAKLGLFVRYNQWDNLAASDSDNKYAQADIGLNYWPHPDVVIKMDYQDQDVPAGTAELDGFNLGIGYQF
ncbi:MAG: porin [Thiohalomonadales bacterium]